MNVATEPARRPSRERLLDAADALFLAEGVQSVGIDRVIADAGTAKATLYNIFGSKEALVRAYLERHHGTILARLRRAAAQAQGPRDAVVAVFDAQAAYFVAPGFRGCPFAAASAEAPSGGEIEGATRAYRRDVRSLLTDLAADAGSIDAAAVGRQLHLVYDGALTTARLDDDPGIATDARATVEVLLDAALDRR